MAPALSLYGKPSPVSLRTLIHEKDKELIPLEKRLKQIAENIRKDSYMLMEYLGPVVDGCRAAFNVSLDRAQTLDEITEPEFDSYMSATDDSYRDIGFCFKSTDTDEQVSLIFSNGKPEVFDECLEPNVIIVGELETLLIALDSDSKISPPDLLGSKISIKGEDSQDVVAGLGLLCYPSLLRVASSGVDPSSLLSEDAVIMATASDLVVKMIRKWIDLQVASDDQSP